LKARRPGLARRWPWARQLTLAALSVAPALAGAQPLAPLLACRQLTDTSARLQCFDREAAALAASKPAASPPAAAAHAAPQAPAAPAAASPATPVSSARALQTFGLSPGAVAAQEVAAGIRPRELTRIEAHIADLSVAAGGRATFTLDNGQVWRQLLAEGDLLARPGDPVTISRGALSSYWLQLKSGRGCKVTRVL
jgi:hypothetical protein